MREFEEFDEFYDEGSIAPLVIVSVAIGAVVCAIMAIYGFCC